VEKLRDECNAPFMNENSDILNIYLCLGKWGVTMLSVIVARQYVFLLSIKR